MMKKFNLSFLLLNIGYAEHHSDWNWYNIRNPFFRIYYVAKGHARVTIDGEVYPLTQGHLYMIPPMTIHSDNCDSTFHLYYIHVFEELQKDISIFDLKTFPFEIDATAFEIDLIKRLHTINPNKSLAFYDPKKYTGEPFITNLFVGKNNYDFIETRGILLVLFSRFLAMAKDAVLTKDNRIFKAIRFIREHLSESIKINDLTNECCLSEDHFIRLFKKEMGITPIDYINRKKIEQCQLRLLLCEDSIQEVAYSVSIFNISYFNKLFKKIVGTTPSEFKNNYNSTS